MSVYADTLRAGAAALGLEVSDDEIARMERHHALVVKWSKKINLTTVTADDRAAIVHGLDSLLFAEPIARDDSRPTVDVGSGAGFPGVVLAIVRPRLPLTLLEPIRKRASFLRTVLADLGLREVRVVEGKLESAPEGPPWPAERIVSRATIPPLELIERSAPHLVPGGELVVSGGAGAPSEAEVARVAGAVGMSVVVRRGYALPGGEQRVVDVLRRR